MSNTHATESELIASQKLEDLNKNIDYHAIIKIYDLPKMNSYRKSRLVEWMRELADAIDKEEKQEDFAEVYTVRMMK